jgi:hypothetical protein
VTIPPVEEEELVCPGLTHLASSAHGEGPEEAVWRVEVYIHATDDEAEDVVERLGAALCPDAFHPGYCPVPWSILRFRPKGKAAKCWKRYFREERAAAKSSGDLSPVTTEPS